MKLPDEIVITQAEELARAFSDTGNPLSFCDYVTDPVTGVTSRVDREPRFEIRNGELVTVWRKL